MKIIYCSNTAFTRQYANMLSQKLRIELYILKI